MKNLFFIFFIFLTSKILAENNSDWLTHFVKAEKAYHLKDGNQAIEEYTKAIEFAPDQLSAYMGRGKTYEKMRKYEEAIQDFSFIINYQMFTIRI